MSWDLFASHEAEQRPKFNHDSHKIRSRGTLRKTFTQNNILKQLSITYTSGYKEYSYSFLMATNNTMPTQNLSYYGRLYFTGLWTWDSVISTIVFPKNVVECIDKNKEVPTAIKYESCCSKRAWGNKDDS